MSLLINYSTKFLRSSGAICKAFILKERSIYIIPYVFVFYATYCSNLAL